MEGMFMFVCSVCARVEYARKFITRVYIKENVNMGIDMVIMLLVSYKKTLFLKCIEECTYTPMFFLRPIYYRDSYQYSWHLQ